MLSMRAFVVKFLFTCHFTLCLEERLLVTGGRIIFGVHLDFDWIFAFWASGEFFQEGLTAWHAGLAQMRLAVAVCVKAKMHEVAMIGIGIYMYAHVSQGLICVQFCVGDGALLSLQFLT